MLKHVEAGVLDIAYLEDGPADGPPAILLHGFPYDVHAYAEVTPRLVAAGHRVIVPYLRGYGPTRFLSSDTLRSGQQAALGHDLLALMDALSIPKALLAGYDWGGRAACIVAALWPERVTGLVSQNGYNMHHVGSSDRPAHPENERRHWYQYYFHGERGRRGLDENRFDLCKLLWQTWSPNWVFDDETYARSAKSFENPDFVDVVVHSYRVRFGLVDGDPALEETERRLEAQPAISIPTVVLDGDGDGVLGLGGSEEHARHFTGHYRRQVIPLAGHNLPQEVPGDFSEAILSLA
jgi:pimeloyl-ACP methyl ester carboxylesterase